MGVHHKRLRWMILCLFLSAVWADGAQGPDVEGWERARWHAHLIASSDKPPAHSFGLDHATQRYGDPWDFDEGDTEGIDEFGQGLTDVRASDGTLRFVTGGGGNYFFWGDYRLDTPSYGAEKIDFVTRRQVWWGPRHLRIRLKQSLPKSHWTFSSIAENKTLRFGPFINHRRVEVGFEVEGTQWRTIDIKLPQFAPLWAVCLETTEPNNEIAIDWIRLEAEVPSWYFRTTFDLEEDATGASFVLLCSPNYTLYVNGQVVKSDRNVSVRAYERADCEGLLKKGRNCIALTVEGFPFGARGTGVAAVEGIVHLKSGSWRRVFTDDSWRARCAAAAGWTQVDFDDSAWPQAVSCGNVGTSDFGYLPGKDSWGYFIGPPYLGPITVQPVGRREPIFHVDEMAVLEITVPAQEGAEHGLSFTLYDAFSGSRIASEQMPVEGRRGRVDIYRFKRKLMSIGPKYLYLKLTDADGRIIDDRYYEIVTVGPIKQREVAGESYEEGLELELVDEIDCTDPNDPHPFCDGPFVNPKRLREIGRKLEDQLKLLGDRGRSHIVETKLGTFRVTGNRTHDWFGYGFLIKNPGRPHLVVAEYPDDGYRCANIIVHEKHGFRGIPNDPTGHRGWPRTGGAVYTGGDYPVTNTRRRLRQIYWPVGREAAVVVCQGISPLPAAISHIWIYEIKNDVPMLASPGASERLFGIHNERGNLVATSYYSGGYGIKFIGNLHRTPYVGFYKDWYLAIENMIKHMHFVGHNVYVGGIYMYFDPYYPSASTAPPGWYNSYRAPRADYWGIMARMFAANDLKLILNIEFKGTAAMIERDVYADYEVRHMSAPTLKSVRCDGTQSTEQAGQRAGFDVFHPEFEKEFFAIIDELCERYADYPGIAGIGQITGRGWGFQIATDRIDLEDYLNWGYSDASIAAWEADTGIRVPVDTEGPERLEQRQKWLLTNEREKWIAWRNDRIKRLHLTVRDRVVQADPDWRYFMFVNCLPAGCWKAYLEGKKSIHEVLREAGQDPMLYKNERGIVLSSMFVNHQRVMAGRPEEFWTLRTVYTTDEMFRLYDNGIQTGVYPHMNFYEPHIPVAREWVMDFVEGGGYPFPSGRGLLDRFGLALAHCTPIVMPDVWCDMVLLSAHEQELREVARSLRAIPVGQYETLRGSGLDRNIAVRVCSVEDATHFYVVNRLWDTVHVSLNLTGAEELHDLVTGRSVPLQGDRAEFDMKPYETRLFSTRSGARVISAGVQWSPEAAARVSERLADARLVAARIAAAGTAGLDEDARKSVAKFRERFEAIERAFGDGDLALASDMLDDQRWREALARAEGAMLSQSWLVIGPFANRDGTGFDTVYPVEADTLAGKRGPQYQGMDDQAVGWREVKSALSKGTPGHLDFERIFWHRDWVVAYAYTRIHSPTARTATLTIGSDDGVKVWINRRLVLTGKGPRGAEPGQDTASVQFHAGWNEVLVKLEEQTGAWELFFDILGDDGERLWDMKYSP